MASTVEDRPEREKKTSITQPPLAAVQVLTLTYCTIRKCSYTVSTEAEPLHTFYIHAANHSGTVSLCSLSAGRFPMNSPGLCFFIKLKVSQEDCQHIQYMCCELSPHELHHKKVVRHNTFSRQALSKRSHNSLLTHGVWRHTHPLFRTQINTHQRWASLNF